MNSQNNLNIADLTAKPNNPQTEENTQLAENSQLAKNSLNVENTLTGEVSPEQVFSLGQEAKTDPFPGNSRPSEPSKPFSQPTPGNPVNARPMPLGNVVGGKFAVDLMDSLLPALISYLVGFIGYDLDKKGLQFTQKEKDIIIPPMQDYLNSINVNFNNPLYNLLFAIGIVYTSKVVDILPNIKAKDKPKEPLKKEAILKEAEKSKSKVEKQAVQKQSRQVFIESLKGLEREVAIDLIASRRKLGKQDAVRFYNENVRK